MLEQLLSGTIEVRDKHIYQGRERVEVSLVSDDAQTLHFYEGQLKELGKNAPKLEVGKKYRVTFRPFVNNRWIEVKLVQLELA
jgi:hypothetical protein